MVISSGQHVCLQIKPKVCPPRSHRRFPCYHRAGEASLLSRERAWWVWRADARTLRLARGLQDPAGPLAFVLCPGRPSPVRVPEGGRQGPPALQ